MDDINNKIDGRLWVSKEQKNFLGKGRIELLRHIDDTGSISKAAKRMKMSYKAAWDAVDAMNNLSESPLVERATGGKGGGGTHLTSYAKELIDTYEIINLEHQRFLKNLSLRINEQSGHLRLLQSLSLRMSARNQLAGRVSKIHKGAVNSEVELSLYGDDKVTAIITNESLEELEVHIDTELFALFKSQSVVLSSDTSTALLVSNKFEGNVLRIKEGSVNCEVVVQLKGKNTIVSTITKQSFQAMQLEIGQNVVAFCDASSVILGVQ